MINKKTAKKATEKKSVTPELITKVLRGEYGAPEERSAKLKAEGYNPSVVTKKINDLAKLADQIRPLTEKVGDYGECLLILLHM